MALALFRPAPRGCSRRKQRGFIDLSILRLLLLSGRRFRPQDLFRAGEPGFHFEAYDPNTILRRRNRVTYSEAFSNAAWTKSEATVSVANVLIPSTNAIAHYVTQNQFAATEQAVIARVRVRLTTAIDKVTLYPGGSGTFAHFNLTAVSTTREVNTTSSTIVSAGGGLYDLTATWSGEGAQTYSLLRIYASSGANGSSTTAGDGTSGVEIVRADIRKVLDDDGTYQLVTDWNTEYIAAGGSNIGMYQDAAGTTAAWGVEQPVGKWMDWKGVKGAAGNHATQATAGSRPILSARYNVRTKTEQIGDAAWTKTDVTVTANSVAAPDGNTTADLLTEGSAGTARTSQSATIVASAPWMERVSLKRGNTDWVLVNVTTSDFTTSGFQAWVNLNTGALGTSGVVGTGTLTSATIVSQGSGWYAVTLKGLLAANTSAAVSVHSASADNSTTRVNGATYYLWGDDGRYSNDAALNQPAYQRVNTSTDYDTDGFIHYLKFDGTDDSFVTPSIDFSVAESIALWTGQTKSSDAATGAISELSTTSSAGTFSVFAATNYTFRSRGSVTVDATTASASFAAPYSGVLVGRGSTLLDVCELRANGSLVVANGADQGTSGYINAAVYIGRRGGASLPLNGRLTSLTVRGTTTPTSDLFIRQMEQYAARLAGQSFAST